MCALIFNCLCNAVGLPKCTSEVQTPLKTSLVYCLFVFICFFFFSFKFSLRIYNQYYNVWLVSTISFIILLRTSQNNDPHTFHTLFSCMVSCYFLVLAVEFRMCIEVQLIEWSYIRKIETNSC